MASSSLFLRPYVDAMSKYTDAPPIFHHVSALCAMGALLSRQDFRCQIAAGVPPHWTNLWVLLVGPSGRGRKSTCIEMTKEIITRIDQTLCAPDEMSPEGFLEYLDTKQAQASDPSTIFIQPEFTGLLMQFRKKYAEALRMLMLQLHDSPSTYSRVVKKRSFILTRPRAAMIGGIAQPLLAQYSQPEDWLGGFFNRCLIISAPLTTEKRDVAYVPSEVQDKLAVILGTKVLLPWQEAQRKRGEPLMKLSEAAKKISHSMPDAPTEPHLNATLARANMHFLKVAAIEQLDEDPTSREIERGAAERALKLIAYWRENIPGIIDECFCHGRESFEGDRLSKTLLRYLKDAGGSIEYRQLLNHCAMDVDAIDRALRALKLARRVDSVTNDEGQETLTFVK